MKKKKTKTVKANVNREEDEEQEAQQVHEHGDLEQEEQGEESPGAEEEPCLSQEEEPFPAQEEEPCLSQEKEPCPALEEEPCLPQDVEIRRTLEEELSPIKRRNSVLKSLQAGGLETSIKKTGASGFKAAKRKSRLNDSDKITFGASGSNDKTYTDTEIENSYEECGEKKRQKNKLLFNSDSDDSFNGFE